MPLCNACNFFFKNAFRPPSKQSQLLWFRTKLTHLRPAQLVESAIACNVCALLKYCSKRAFQQFLEDDEDGTFLRFMATNFPDQPISLVLNQDTSLDVELSHTRPPMSKAILAQIPEFGLGSHLPEHLEASCAISLSIWAAKDSPASRSGEVCDIPPIRHDGSVDSYRFVRSYLANCLENHKGEECSKTFSGAAIEQSTGSALPTRVIDVMNGRPHVKLIETNGQRGHYVALSHCWGPPERQSIRSLRSNLQQHLSGILLTELPKTFYEAVETTRAVGIQYLWIDSLCIIQDDESDWKREAKTMGSLYERAEFTIAAISATNPSEGLFLAGRQSTDPIVEVPYCPNGQDCEGTIFLSAGTRKYSHSASSPLDQRAWAFQERHLPRRILHCTAAGLFWSCKRKGDLGMPWGVDERCYSIYRGPDPTMAWHKHIEHYTERLLTYESDRLIAIQGIATEVGKTRPDVYHMGIWMDDLPFSLLWFRPYDASNDYQLHIPSWSWASILGRKWFAEGYSTWQSRLSSERVWLDEGSEYIMNHSLLARTAAATDGGLIVDSYLKWGAANGDIVETAGSRSSQTMHNDVKGTYLYAPFWYPLTEAYFIVDGEGEKIGRAAFDVGFTAEFYCLFLCNGSSDHPYEWAPNDWFHYVLLLEKRSEPSTFRRIGLGIIMLQTWFEGEKVQQVHLM